MKRACNEPPTKRRSATLFLAAGAVSLNLIGCQAEGLLHRRSEQANPLKQAEDGPSGTGAVEQIENSPMVSSKEEIDLPPVDGDRLWQNLASLVGQRYWARERAAAREQITASLVALGWDVQEQAFEQGINLVATYPLKEPLRGGEARDGEAETGELLVGAHYDTVKGSPGADDNGTGVAVLLEIAALYGLDLERWSAAIADPTQPSVPRPGSLKLVFFDQEEQGLLGSLAFTAEPANLASLRGAVVLDMLGASCEVPGCQQYPAFLEQIVPGQRLSQRGDFIAVVGEAERPNLLGAFGGLAEGNGSADLPDVLRVPVPFKGLLTPDVLRSDHAGFWLNGVEAVLVTDTANLRNPHYHQPSDDLSQVDPIFFVGSAQQVVNGVWRLLYAMDGSVDR